MAVYKKQSWIIDIENTNKLSNELSESISEHEPITINGKKCYLKSVYQSSDHEFDISFSVVKEDDEGYA